MAGIHKVLEAENLPFLKSGKEMNVRLDQFSPVLDSNGVPEPFSAFFVDIKKPGKYRVNVVAISEGVEKSKIRIIVPRVFLFSLPEGKNLMNGYKPIFGQHLNRFLIIRNTCKVNETVELKEGGKYLLLIASNGEFFGKSVSGGSVITPYAPGGSPYSGAYRYTYNPLIEHSWEVKGSNYGRFKIRILPEKD